MRANWCSKWGGLYECNYSLNMCDAKMYNEIAKKKVRENGIREKEIRENMDPWFEKGSYEPRTGGDMRTHPSKPPTSLPSEHFWSCALGLFQELCSNLCSWSGTPNSVMMNIIFKCFDTKTNFTFWMLFSVFHSLMIILLFSGWPWPQKTCRKTEVLGNIIFEQQYQI